jgi:hypothetical protein
MKAIPIVFVLILAASWALCCRSARACGLAAGANERVEIDTEGALIVWDGKRHLEHFVRSATFHTTAKSFGFLVPTPTRPTLADADSQAFQALLDITRPAVEQEWRLDPQFVGFTSDWLVNAGVLPPYWSGAARPEKVTVVEQAYVAGLDATVLLASDTSAVSDWLIARGFDVRPALRRWLDVYVAKGWHITAFRYDKSASSTDTITSRALRITFSVEQPVYPYLEPADTEDRQGRRLDLFVVADGRVDGVLSDDASRPWNARPTFATLVWRPENRQEDPVAVSWRKLAAALPGVELPDRPWLSELDDRSTKRAEADVFFHASDSVVEIHKKPVRQIRWHTVTVPYEVPFVVVPLAWLGWRLGTRLRRRATTWFLTRGS